MRRLLFRAASNGIFLSCIVCTNGCNERPTFFADYRKPALEDRLSGSATKNGDISSEALTILPDKPHLMIGQALPLKAVKTDAAGNSEDVTATGVWTSNDSIVAMDSERPGVALPKSTGRAKVSVNLGDLHAEVEVDVLGLAVADIRSLQVSADKTNLLVGEHAQLLASATLIDNSVIDVTDVCQWLSESESIISVGTSNNSGKPMAEAIGVGGAYAVAHISVNEKNSLSASVELKVTDNTINLLQIEPLYAVSLTPADEVSFSAVGYHVDYDPSGLEATRTRIKSVTDEVLWSSSDMQVLTISNQAGAQGFAKAERYLSGHTSPMVIASLWAKEKFVTASKSVTIAASPSTTPTSIPSSISTPTPISVTKAPTSIAATATPTAKSTSAQSTATPTASPTAVLPTVAPTLTPTPSPSSTSTTIPTATPTIRPRLNLNVNGLLNRTGIVNSWSKLTVAYGAKDLGPNTVCHINASTGFLCKAYRSSNARSEAIGSFQLTYGMTQTSDQWDVECKSSSPTVMSDNTITLSCGTSSASVVVPTCGYRQTLINGVCTSWIAVNRWFVPTPQFGTSFGHHVYQPETSAIDSQNLRAEGNPYFYGLPPTSEDRFTTLNHFYNNATGDHFYSSAGAVSQYLLQSAYNLTFPNAISENEPLQPVTRWRTFRTGAETMNGADFLDHLLSIAAFDGCVSDVQCGEYIYTNNYIFEGIVGYGYRDSY